MRAAECMQTAGRKGEVTILSVIAIDDVSRDSEPR